MRDVKDVEFAACGWFGGGFAGWVVRDVVAVDDVLVSFVRTLLSHGCEHERESPHT